MYRMNEQARELTINDLEVVSGGKKGDSGALDAASKIDLSAFLAQLDHAIAKAKQA
jgi:hypothetical protein